MILIGRGLDLKEIRRKDFQRIEEASEDLRSFEVEKEGCPGQTAERRTTACAVLRVRKSAEARAIAIVKAESVNTLEQRFKAKA